MTPRGASSRGLRAAACAVLALAVGLAVLWLARPHADGPARADAPVKNGFVLSPSAVPPIEIQPGGPKRDGIPALEAPKAVPASVAPWDPDDMVVGVEIGRDARAYPIALLTYHELVNDELGDRPILVSFCPLCGSALVFDRRVEGSVHRFGVSGLLFQSDLLMFDRETESLWSQIAARAVTGKMLGRRLDIVRSRIERWGRWKVDHPQTTVLSRDTGYTFDYDHPPYAEYAESEQLYFPVDNEDPRYHPKMPVVGLVAPDGEARVYPAFEMRKVGGVVREHFAGESVRVAYDLDSKVFRVDAPDSIAVIESYWFAWAAFYPTTEVFVAPKEAAPPRN